MGSSSPKGKHVTIDINNPDALGRCDYTGFIHNRSDLKKQYEWRGNALVWTGFWVGISYLDEPNEQLRTPIYPPDPIPIRYPKPPLDGDQVIVPEVGGFEARLSAEEFNWGE